MIKLRRRTEPANAGSDLPFCAMCNQGIRVDAATGRCALGHRVAAPAAGAFAAVSQEATAVLEPAAFDATVPLETVEDPAFSPGGFSDDRGIAGEGLYEAYQSADAVAGHSATWDDVVAPAESGIVYDDYATWDEPTSAFSSLDVDADALPEAIAAVSAVDDEDYDYDTEAATPAAPARPSVTPVSSDLLDELDDAAYARRKAAGTFGATIAITGAVFAAVAMLPL